MIDNDYVTPHLFLKKNIIILCSGSSDKRQLTSWRQTSFCVYFHLCILNRTSVFKFQISQCPNSLLMSCHGQNINFSNSLDTKPISFPNLTDTIWLIDCDLKHMLSNRCMCQFEFQLTKIRTLNKYCYSNNFDICTAIRKTLIKISHNNRLLHNMICLRFSRLLSL